MADVPVPDLTPDALVSMPLPAEPPSRPAQRAAQPRRPKRPWLWLPLFVYAAGIFIVSGMSQPPVPLPGSGSDKYAHSAAYAGFGLLAVRALAGARWVGVTGGRCLLAGGIAVLYGASDELHQAIVPGRTADVRDFAADAAGAAAGIATMWLLARLKRSER